MQFNFPFNEKAKALDVCGMQSNEQHVSKF